MRRVSAEEINESSSGVLGGRNKVELYSLSVGIKTYLFHFELIRTISGPVFVSKKRNLSRRIISVKVNSILYYNRS